MTPTASPEAAQPIADEHRKRLSEAYEHAKSLLNLLSTWPALASPSAADALDAGRWRLHRQRHADRFGEGMTERYVARLDAAIAARKGDQTS